jgi:hypothetical protein
MLKIIRPDGEMGEEYKHEYVKELTKDGIIVYDPNLSFTSCSDMSITDIYLPHDDFEYDYSFVTERIRFLGGNENKLFKIIGWVVGVIATIAIIGLIIYFVNKGSNETFYSKDFQEIHRHLK